MDELRVLGPVELIVEDEPVALATMHRRLLAVIAVADGRVCEVDALVDALWEERPPSSARKLLQLYVSQLRKALPPRLTIVTRPGGYALEIDPRNLDAARFERLLADAAEARRDANPALALSLIQRALALWRGRAFGELAFDEALRGEAERLEDLRLMALEDRIDAELALDRHSEVVAEVLSLAHDNPLRERMHELAMLALYRSGRQSDALEQYSAARARLDEIGLEPGPRLRTLQRSILTQDPELQVPVETSSRPAPRLPVPPTPLVGREQELDALARLLHDREARLVVLTGAGGSGKTRLAVEAARRLEASYANGAVLVELAPLRDPDLVLPTIARGLGVTEEQDEPLLDTLGKAVQTRELLLVVDNAEHVRESLSSLVELLARAPRMTALVTSRFVLHVSGEHVLPVLPLSDEDAADLFVQRAHALDAELRLDDDTGQTVREICRRVDGLPLAIELAAARLLALTPAMLLDRLSERLGVLTGGHRDLPARQQTLRATLDWSVELLGERERDVLARLALFPSGATLAAAEAVCGADLDTLGALIAGSLVRRSVVNGEPRYGMLETVREYALELLGDDVWEAEEALLEYLSTYAEQADFDGPVQSVWIARLDAELDNLRVALDIAAQHGDPDAELKLAGKLWPYWWVRGDLDEGVDRLESALERGVHVVSGDKARALAGIAGLDWSRGNLERAEQHAALAIEVARATGALAEEASAHTTLGVIANQRKEFATARRHYELGIELAREVGVESAAAMLNLAIVEIDSGRPEAAIAPLEELLDYHRRNEIVQGIGFASLNLGLARHRMGESALARKHFEDARAAFAQIGFRVHVASALQGLAACAVEGARFAEAARLLGAADAELGDISYGEEEFRVLAAAARDAARAALGGEAFEAEHAAARPVR